MMTSLEAINSAALKFLVPMSIEKTYSTIVDEAIRLVKAEYGSIILKTGKDVFERVYASIPLAHKTINRPKGNTYKAFRERIPLLVSIDHTKTAHPELTQYGIKWTLFIPLSYESRSIGVLTINSRHDQMPTEEDLPILKLFGSLASLSIEKTRLYEQTKSSLELRDLFISVASHELNTPLTAILGYAQMLKRRLASDEKANAWGGSLLQEVERMRSMVKDLLALNKIKQGDFSFSFEMRDIIDLVDRTMINFSMMYPKRKIRWINNCAGEQYIICDAHKMMQVLTNLIGNAIKFSDDHTDVIVVTRSTKKRVVIEVIDQGIGIPKNDLAKVFLGFYKGKHEKKGMGIGLFLSKYFVEKHQGSIRVKSKEEKGTTFSVSLPRV